MKCTIYDLPDRDLRNGRVYDWRQKNCHFPAGLERCVRAGSAERSEVYREESRQVNLSTNQLWFEIWDLRFEILRMKRIIFASLLILIISCTSGNFDQEKAFVEGYWEIKSVEMADGTTREFDVTTSVDYIMVTGDSGVRKKLMPKVDGSFTEFPTSEKFIFTTKGDSLFMHYTTPFASWNETVVKATENLLITKNKDGKRFEYKRFEKLNFSE